MNMYVYVYTEKYKKDKTNFILWFKELIKYNAHWFSSSLDWLHNQSKYYSLRLQFLRCTHKHACTHTPQMHEKLNQSLQNNRKLLQYFEFLKSPPPQKNVKWILNNSKCCSNNCFPNCQNVYIIWEISKRRSSLQLPNEG